MSVAEGATHGGLYIRQYSEPGEPGQPGLFLDRDGVIVEDCDYLHRTEDVQLISETARAVAEVNRAHLPVIVVTNQAGIGRGYYGWRDFCAVQEHIRTELSLYRASVDLVTACAFHRDGTPDYAVADHPWRKPGPGMLLEAARRLQLNLSRSLIVGDQLSDLEAGLRAGLRRGALVGDRDSLRGDLPDVLSRWKAHDDFTVTVARSSGMAIRSWLASVVE